MNNKKFISSIIFKIKSILQYGKEGRVRNSFLNKRICIYNVRDKVVIRIYFF